jgi:hypothetical protein
MKPRSHEEHEAVRDVERYSRGLGVSPERSVERELGQDAQATGGVESLFVVFVTSW